MPKRHFTRQTVDVIRSEKKKRRTPTIIAPKTLVAGNVIANNIIERSIVPNIPARTNDKGVSIQPHNLRHLKLADTIRFTARYTTAIPKRTHKNAGVTVITAVIVSKVAIIPTIALAPIANNEH